MRKLRTLLLIVLGIYSCQSSHPQEYLSISGELHNRSSKDSLLLITGFAVKKEIKVNKDGTFKDSLKVAKANYYSFSTSSGKRGFIYLKNGYNLHLTGDYDNFMESFKYKGDVEGAQSNNFLIDRFNIVQKLGNINNIMTLDKKSFFNRIQKLKTDIDNVAHLYPKANKDLIKSSIEQNKKMFSDLKNTYDRVHEKALKKKTALARLEKGKIAPEFNNYLDFRGGKKSLKDFRGNYVYIDVWATWCKPCIAQIPFLKKLEKDYEGKNLKIVSISTDSNGQSSGSWNKAKAKWRKMVKDKNLTGIQLWAGKDNRRFSHDYMVRGIPRFILIDPEGKIVDSDAPRPFSPKIRTFFNSVLE